jgi:hypothetical protein
VKCREDKILAKLPSAKLYTWFLRVKENPKAILSLFRSPSDLPFAQNVDGKIKGKPHKACQQGTAQRLSCTYSTAKILGNKTIFSKAIRNRRFFPIFELFKKTMLKKQGLILFTLILWGIPLKNFAQTLNHYPFVPHEDIQLVAYYNLGPLWVHAGNVELTADTLTYRGTKSIHLVATGISLKKYAFIFRLKDYYQAIVSSSDFRPLFYEKSTLEGGYYIHNIYHFHWERHNADIHTETSRHPKKDTLLPLKKLRYDALSATYYLRILNTSYLHVGDTLPVPLIIDGKKTTYYIIYAGKGEMVERKKKIPCDVYKAVILNSTFFSDTDPLTIYVSADKNRYPIYVEANIIVGSIKVYMLPYLDYKPKFKVRKHR